MGSVGEHARNDSGRQEARVAGRPGAGRKGSETSRSDHFNSMTRARTAQSGDSERQPAPPYRPGKRHDCHGRQSPDETIHGNEKNDATGEQDGHAIAAQPNAQPLSLKEKEDKMSVSYSYEQARGEEKTVLPHCRQRPALSAGRPVHRTGWNLRSERVDGRRAGKPRTGRRLDQTGRQTIADSFRVDQEGAENKLRFLYRSPS